MIPYIYKQYQSLVIDNADGVFSKDNLNKCIQSQKLIENADSLFFIGNGGSHASCCLHLVEDFVKVANKKAYTLENPSLISCLENDYPHDEVYVEWLKRFWVTDNSLLIAISSSGESNNIINAVNYIKKDNGKSITLSAHKSTNRLALLGDINFHIPTKNYGAAETYHQLLLHMILDSYIEDKESVLVT